MQIATWNVNGIRARQQQFLDWLVRDRPDVVCLQEIKATPDQLGPELAELGGYHSYWHGAGGYSGVSLHVAKTCCPEPPRFTHPDFDLETRIVEVALGTLDIASVYVPNGGKDYPTKVTFIEAMERWAQAKHAAGRQLIVCGDMNVAFTERDVHPKERKLNIIGQRPEERALFDRLLATGLVDIGRTLDADNEGLFTWWPYWRNMRQRNIGWRLDYVLASQPLVPRITTHRVLTDVGTSDHAPVLITLSD